MAETQRVKYQQVLHRGRTVDIQITTHKNGNWTVVGSGYASAREYWKDRSKYAAKRYSKARTELILGSRTVAKPVYRPFVPQVKAKHAKERLNTLY